MKALDKTITFFLAAVLIFSGIDKLLHYQGFINALRDYVIIPKSTAVWLALPVILCELMIGVSLLIRPWRRPALLATAALLSVFTVALATNHAFGGRAICGCWFTITLARGTMSHIAQNLIMAVLALTVWWSAGEGRKLPAPATT